MKIAIRKLVLMGVVLPGFIGLSGMALAGTGVPPGDKAAPSPNAVFTRACGSLAITNVKVDDAQGKSTSSSTYANLLNGNVAFRQGGTTASCVVVDFSAYSFAPAGRLLMVRAVLDGVTVAAPFEVQFSGNDDDDGDGQWARSHAFNFLFPSVSPGLHTVAIQFRSFFDTQQVFIHRHSVVVRHR